MRVFAAAALLLVSACITPSALPVRGVLAGAPGRLRANELEVSGSALGFMTGIPPFADAPAAWGGWAGYGLSDAFALEAGGLMIPFGAGAGFGFAGGRWTKRLWGGLIGDLDAGLGAGGTLCISTNCTTRAPRVFELGLTQGAGLGYQLAAWTFFARGKLEEGKTLRGPPVLWPSGVVGAEVRVAKALALGVSVGALGFFELGGPSIAWVPTYQLQVTLFPELAVLRSK